VNLEGILNEISQAQRDNTVRSPLI
jgi:hypothetical protein